MQLAAICSSLSAKDLEAFYRLQADSDTFQVRNDVHPEEAFESVEQMECLTGSAAQDQSDQNPLQVVLDQIKETTAECLKNEDDNMEEQQTTEDPDKQLPDGDLLIKLTDDSLGQRGDDDVPSDWQPPRTLTEALLLALHLIALTHRVGKGHQMESGCSKI